ncbi:MAG: hypothetical protein J6P07_08305 [Spirochaetaceae bacterium]|nr:hypothetical protein [Spirochaetaceae bacterium]
MSKKILVLEPSTTTQSIITAKLRKSEFRAVYETNGINFLVTLCDIMPQAVLINAKSINPKSSELIRLIKSMEKLKKIPIGVYAAGDFYFESHFMINTGADLFIHFEPETIVEKIKELIASKNNPERPA